MNETVDDDRALTVMTTEHVALQTARASTTSESTSRVGIYLTAVSGALVALAFVAQLSRWGCARAGGRCCSACLRPSVSSIACLPVP